MLQNYLSIATRNLLKHKGFSLINILGLAVGIACCLVILMFVADESGHDRFWNNGDRIHRMALIRKYPDRETGYAIIPASYAGSVKKDCPEVEETVRVTNVNQGATLFRYEDRLFEERTVLNADSTFFKVFQIPVLKGDPEKCLAAPNSIVMTESTARRYFGEAEAVGKTIQRLDGQQNPQALTVTAVCADLPKDVHFTFDLLGTTSGVEFFNQPNHVSFSVYTYFLLKPGADSKALEAKFPGIVDKYAAGEIQRNFGVNYDEYRAAGNGYHYFLQPVQDIHLRSHLEYEALPTGSATMVYLFTVIAGFILLIACINFMNLATARSAERAREVGIRKTLGSERGQIAGQFLFEAILISLLAAVVGVGLAQGILPTFNQLADKQISLGQFISPVTVIGFLAFAVLTGLLAGSYPAAVLSGFNPIEVLKGKFTSHTKGVWLRNGLVVFQFAISICLIISTIVVFNQLNFISNKKLGFDKEHVVTIENAFVLQQKTEAFKDELARLPGVVSVGSTSEMPGGLNYFGTSFKQPGAQESITGRGIVADDDYVKTMGLELTAGRAFSPEFNDSLSVILNEKAARDLGFSAENLEDALGKPLVQPGAFFDPEGKDVTFTVAGVVKDFHFQSLHEPIVPLFVMHDKLFQGVNGLISVRIEPAHFQSFEAQAAALWKKFVPEQPYHQNFLDANIAALYASEQRAKRLFSLFAGLAIFIACIGLLGLAAYITQQRTKEIGIRRVLGATTGGIVGLLSKDFLKLVILSLVIASPLAWWAMDKWLEDFAYRIQIGWWVFVAAGVVAVAVAFLTVSFQSVKAAWANPVRSLRSE